MYLTVEELKRDYPNYWNRLVRKAMCEPVEEPPVEEPVEAPAEEAEEESIEELTKPAETLEEANKKIEDLGKIINNVGGDTTTINITMNKAKKQEQVASMLKKHFDNLSKFQRRAW
jgi:hypothetical protein